MVVSTHPGHHGQSDQIANQARQRNELLSSLAHAQISREQIDHGRYEAFHSHELRAQSQKQDHDEEHDRPQLRPRHGGHCSRVGNECQARARGDHTGYAGVLLVRHVTDDGEDGETGVE